MDNFKLRIEEIARKFVDKNCGTDELKTDRTDGVEAIKFLFEIFQRGVDAFNHCANGQYLKLNYLSTDLLSLMLSTSEVRYGFCIISPNKYACVFDQNDSGVLAIGNEKKTNEGSVSFLTGAKKLINLGYKKEGKGYIFNDNTGNPVDPEENALIMISWTVN